MDSNTLSSPKVDVYKIVTDRIIELLEKGVVPWQKPWSGSGLPANLLSKRPYRGVNLWLLLSLNYERNLFLTWDQLKKIGGSVKQGEHGHVVVFWKTIEKTEDEGSKSVPLLRYYKVFNIEQCKDIPDQLVPVLVHRENDPISECEAIISGMPQCPVIKHKENSAYYHVGEDYVCMPKKKNFKSSESYYSTLFHELVHSSGSEKRLNRQTITEMAEFGSERYSIEELIAELGAAYLCSFAGILANQIIDNTAYIKGWLAKLKDDKRFIVRASGYSQRAVDYILNQKIAPNEEKEIEPSEMLAEE